MSLFGERSAPLDGEAVATVELVKPKRAYHQPSRERRNRGGRLRIAAPLARMRQPNDHGPDGKAATCVPTLADDADAVTMAG